MPDTFKALAALDLTVIAPTPIDAPAPLTEGGDAMIVYEVPAQIEAIIKMIVVTSELDDQAITLESYVPAFGEVPLFGPIVLGTREWAEWNGSLTLGPGSQVLGCASGGTATVAIYGMERSSP